MKKKGRERDRQSGKEKVRLAYVQHIYTQCEAEPANPTFQDATRARWV
jgi:hypothetical protein